MKALSKTVKRLYKIRFEIFLTTQLLILFGSLIVPADFFEFTVLPLLYLISILAGILMISKRKKLTWFFILLFAVSVGIFGSSMIYRQESQANILMRLSIYFVFHIVVAWNIVQQVWRAKRVNKNVILGLMSGYISLGFLAFFLFMSIELTHPGAFQGALLQSKDFVGFSEAILYYSYITLLTIGYGEIIPVIPIAQKAAMLVGLVGQFYLVIVTAVVVEKYIRHSADN
ncbi:ion channel [Flagellimonas nanhaiensis]|uniref:Two pore domain potassium channel family protein n=1 Tax=Flagellimonas nanhaiensis TaxID=2292706 RepID=A0A371JNE8_9FLAO|nr:ion channel [Allomuricauda nanhaiensis]RDY58728.1 two pore domain potassium channel family protein [Allomuricauda nanhaiensis]